MRRMIDDVPYIAEPVEIGQGGFATVYRATDLQADRPVAVKLLSHRPDDVAISSFDRERAALARLSTHPNVVTLHRTGITTTGVPYLVMEFAPAGTLADRLRSRGPLASIEAIGWMLPVCDAVEHAHGQGVLHRDIKPQNILVSAHDQPLLSDFGIARLAAGTDTVTGKAKLSLSYASPEQIDGRPLDTATDVYSLGATLYTLLAGAPAFIDRDGTGFLNLAKRILDEPPPPLDESIPTRVRAAVMAAMAKDPTARPSVEEFQTALEHAADPSSDPSTEVTTNHPAESRTILASSTDDQMTAIQPSPPVDAGDGGDRRTLMGGGRRRLAGAALVAAVLTGGLVAAALSMRSESDPGADDETARIETGDTVDGLEDSDAGDDGSAKVASDETETTTDPASATTAASTTTSTSASTTTEPDGDGDGVADGADNCPQAENADQVDIDDDGTGDACDADDDNDGLLDDQDNCPARVNPDQADVDADGLGDACDDFPDVDDDGIIDSEDPCVEEVDDPDSDGDGTPDKCDASPRGMVAVSASAQVSRVTIENQAYGDGEADLFGDLQINDTKIDLPIIPDSRDVRPGNWSTGLVELDPGSSLIRVRVWIRDEDDCLFCRDGLVDLSPGASQPLHVVIDSANGDVDLSDDSWNRLETIGSLSGPVDGDLSGTITQRGDDDSIHLGSVDLTLTLQRQPAP